jgi:hypothetical protein
MSIATRAAASLTVAGLLAAAAVYAFGGLPGTSGPGDRANVRFTVEWLLSDGTAANSARITYSGTVGASGGREVPAAKSRRSPWTSGILLADHGAHLRLDAYTMQRDRRPKCTITVYGTGIGDSGGTVTDNAAKSPGTCAATYTVK